LQAVPFKRFFIPPPKSENFAVSPNHQLQADFPNAAEDFLAELLDLNPFLIQTPHPFSEIGPDSNQAEPRA
jgi:hypothetical protein